MVELIQGVKNEKGKTSGLYKNGKKSGSMLNEAIKPTPGELRRQERRRSTLAKEYQDRGGKFFKEKDNSKTEDELGFESETADILGDLTGVGRKTQ